jgi:hypothetical protein
MVKNDSFILPCLWLFVNRKRPYGYRVVTFMVAEQKGAVIRVPDDIPAQVCFLKEVLLGVRHMTKVVRYACHLCRD